MPHGLVIRSWCCFKCCCIIHTGEPGTNFLSTQYCVNQSPFTLSEIDWRQSEKFSIGPPHITGPIRHYVLCKWTSIFTNSIQSFIHDSYSDVNNEETFLQDFFCNFEAFHGQNFKQKCVMRSKRINYTKLNRIGNTWKIFKKQTFFGTTCWVVLKSHFNSITTLTYERFYDSHPSVTG